MAASTPTCRLAPLLLLLLAVLALLHTATAFLLPNSAFVKQRPSSVRTYALYWLLPYRSPYRLQQAAAQQASRASPNPPTQTPIPPTPSTPPKQPHACRPASTPSLVRTRMASDGGDGEPEYDAAARAKIEDVIKGNKIVLFMKGTR